MISADRFLARSSNRDAWLEARNLGVTATMVAKAAAGDAGFRDVLEQRLNPQPIEVNAFMAWGTFMEAPIAEWVKEQTGIMPNEWLIQSDVDARFLATPDGLALDHSLISEIKTMGKPLDKPPAEHVRQMQWQMLCTGASRCFYAWQWRREAADGFQAGWFEPRSLWVERNDAMIDDLMIVALRLLEGETNGI